MKTVKCVFKLNSADYTALIGSLVRQSIAHKAEFDGLQPGRYYVTVLCATFHAEQTIATISESLGLHPSKFTDDGPVTQPIATARQPVQDDGLIKP